LAFPSGKGIFPVGYCKRERCKRRKNMDQNKLLCVDCYDLLEKMVLKDLNVFYCNNIKCRRFCVLTLGGLCGEKCEKSLIIEDKENIRRER
jgi:hypothetical protein